MFVDAAPGGCKSGGNLCEPGNLPGQNGEIRRGAGFVPEIPRNQPCFGEDHTSTAKWGLANVLSNPGEHEKALKLYEEKLDTQVLSAAEVSDPGPHRYCLYCFLKSIKPSIHSCILAVKLGTWTKILLALCLLAALWLQEEWPCALLAVWACHVRCPDSEPFLRESFGLTADEMHSFHFAGLCLGCHE